MLSLCHSPHLLWLKIKRTASFDEKIRHIVTNSSCVMRIGAQCSFGYHANLYILAFQFQFVRRRIVTYGTDSCEPYKLE